MSPWEKELRVMREALTVHLLLWLVLGARLSAISWSVGKIVDCLQGVEDEFLRLLALLF